MHDMEAKKEMHEKMLQLGKLDHDKEMGIAIGMLVTRTK